MVPHFTKTMALALSIAAVVVVAAESIIVVPDPVTANTDFKLNLSTELSQAADYDTYRVFLNIAAKPQLHPSESNDGGNQNYPTSCYLAKSASINSTNPTLQIPSSVGADDGSYAIVLEAYKEADMSVDPKSRYMTSNNSITAKWGSNVFSLTGGTGKWTAADLSISTNSDFKNAEEEQDNSPKQVYAYADPVNVPCTAWDCARNCTSTYAGENSTIRIQGEEYPTAFRDTWNCIGGCQGVTYPAFHELFGLDENYNEIITSTVLGPLSTTATKTVFTTSVSFQSISATGTAIPTSYSNGTLTSVFLSSTASRTATPTIATTPSPTNAGSRVGLVGRMQLLGSSFAIIALLGV
ncbi:hypothetical protein BKA65DRAFT_486651 [Rhexocercosporidium sp. MPI-PUGE-AT-0058]|nr:hypothetical protein BKA65DRAFT_486651 [Rhexocercosporidium sp. MPI-PUGE-AT-0058]